MSDLVSVGFYMRLRQIIGQQIRHVRGALNSNWSIAVNVSVIIINEINLIQFVMVSTIEIFLERIQ